MKRNPTSVKQKGQLLFLLKHMEFANQHQQEKTNLNLNLNLNVPSLLEAPSQPSPRLPSSLPSSAPRDSIFKPPTQLPISTPRRRLRDALKMEKQICEQLMATGWVLVVRAGKKIDGRYALVSAYTKFPDVRVTVYQTMTSQLQELFFTHEEDLSQMDARKRKAVVFEFINGLVYNLSGMLVPNPIDDEERKVTAQTTGKKMEQNKIEEDFARLNFLNNRN